eukprot:Nk52_evm1s49 gene=Nk52_evmTU1s49
MPSFREQMESINLPSLQPHDEETGEADQVEGDEGTSWLGGWGRSTGGSGGAGDQQGGTLFSNPGEDSCLQLSKTQRIIGFITCLGASAVCFGLAVFIAFTPIMLIKPAKFALLFSMGSLFCMMSFALLNGPWNHVKHLFSKERFIFTSGYFFSLFGTLYAILVVHSYLLTAIFSIVQVVALLWYVTSYLPGGAYGFKMFMS